MDVRAKQRLCLERRPLNFNGLSGGFAPRHLSRSVLSCFPIGAIMRKKVILALVLFALTFINSQNINGQQNVETNPPIIEKNNALVEAASKGNVVAVREWLAKGADVNAKGKNGWSSFLTAIFTGHDEVVPELIAAGADVNLPDESQTTLLMHAAYFNRKELVNQLVAAGAKVEEKDKIGRTALILAAERNDPEVVQALVGFGADVNASDNLGRTPLMIAALTSKIDNLKILLSNGANVFAQDKEGKLAVEYATQRGNTKDARKIVKLLKNAAAFEQ
jgi:ankyrin repeat protein